ncbi:MAG: AAA family ATPase [Pseudohongiellaceae bacterium]
MSKITLEKVGPISNAKIDLRDLTVLVGPQASGKSIFLQTLKLAIDRHHILSFFKQHSVVFNGSAKAVLDGYYGRGMGGMLRKKPYVTWKNTRFSIESLTRSKKINNPPEEKLFYIPAQRVVSFNSGISQTFDNFNFGDPYVLRYFAHQIHRLLQDEFGSLATLFPSPQRLNAELRGPIEEHIFGGARLKAEQNDFTNSLALKIRGLPDSLPFLAWSAGQREFVPLLLGLYWLCPAGRVKRRGELEWVVIEEPEMGLHPRAIETFLLLALELISRGYKVVLSTHSTVVLDLIWAIQHIKDSKGNVRDILNLFSLKQGNNDLKKIAKNALTKDYRVYFFERGKPVKDITSLDPGAEDEAISNWGDLNDFSGRSANVVAKVISRTSS